MQVTRDEWSPLLQSLKEKVSEDARHELLFKMISDLRFITQMNFGESGIARPEMWPLLSPNYAHEKKKGNRTPNLILKGDLLRGFRTQVNGNSAILTNDSHYADEHQFGVNYKNLPSRPFYPINEDGSLTQFAVERQEQIVREWFQSAAG
jgi:phage gpG-like protein